MVNVLRESKSCNVENIGKVSNTCNYSNTSNYCVFHSVTSISTLLFRQHGHFRISKKKCTLYVEKMAITNILIVVYFDNVKFNPTKSKSCI